MYARQLAQWAYTAALQMDYKGPTSPGRETVTLAQRISSPGTIGTPDTFSNYQLNRITYRPPRLDELEIAKASLADGMMVWTIYTADPGLVIPDTGVVVVPGRLWEINITNIAQGNWIIETITNSDLLTKYDCLCRIQKINNPK